MTNPTPNPVTRWFRASARFFGPSKSVAPTITVHRDASTVSQGPLDYPSVHSAAPPLPKTLGRFRITGLLGKGGMGYVYEGHDPELGRDVAIKVVTAEAARARGGIRRAVEEARIGAGLDHPNIVPIYEVGEGDGGELFFVMRKIEGISLGELLKGLRRRDPMLRIAWPMRRLLESFGTLCHAVAYAHGAGVIHRDLKPGNVLFGPFGEVLLLDWGVSHRLDDDELGRGVILGTPGYISPEQVTEFERPVDELADVFSLGALLYEILTLHKAFATTSMAAYIHAAIEGDVVPPASRAPTRSIDPGISEVCMRALAPRREDRTPNADTLAGEVEAHLARIDRCGRAAVHLEEAHLHWGEHNALEIRRRHLRLHERDLARALDPWLPLAAKRPLHRVRQELAGIETERAALFARAVGCGERALSQDPGNEDSRAFLAHIYWCRFLAAEDEGDAAQARFLSERAATYGDEDFDARKAGTGCISLATDLEGVRVTCRKVMTTTIPWSLGDEVFLGVTPLRAEPLDRGSWLLTLRHPDRRDTLVPVLVERDQHWHTDVPVGLARRDTPAGFAYVTGGASISGGDPSAQDGRPRARAHLPAFLIAELPVTMGQYCEFINGLAETHPEEAWRRSPRQDTGVAGLAGQYWTRPEPGKPYVVPAVDRDGDPWDPQWPVFGVSWHDAQRYCAWRSERDGRQYRLPTGQEWEKSARGADGRFFPWGNTFDASLCAMRQSFPGRPQPRPVGTFPTDRSVFGVRDVAGGVRDWCGDLDYDGNPDRRPVRGGSWDSAEAYCRVTHRTAYIPSYVSASFGFRLALDVEQ
ncbi:MAG: SUMF1/EgtB/PvdO family nonheme iron enzyme [Deltaproteobacteria bacterium]|nr:SUMF1/EgtB/PvdO family nonheme iron enzyme [Deltaproteobacteria bacterium]